MQFSCAPERNCIWTFGCGLSDRRRTSAWLTINRDYTQNPALHFLNHNSRPLADRCCNHTQPLGLLLVPLSYEVAQRISYGITSRCFVESLPPALSRNSLSSETFAGLPSDHVGTAE